MPYTKKNMQRKRCALPLLLPIVESILTKKSVSLDSSEENTLDFHIEMINKIDRILEKHDQNISSQEPLSQPPIVPTPPPPIEPRPSLFKSQSHTEITWQPTRETPQVSLPVQPEEFKTELSETPEFKFITSLEFNNTFLNLRPRPEDHIEIIDLSSFTEDTVLSNKLPGFIFSKPQGKEQPIIVPLKEQSSTQHRNKKIEVIDARSLTQKTYEDAFLAAEKQSEDIDKKSQIYYLNSKEEKASKQQKTDFKQSNLDLDERAKEIREQQERVQQLQKQLEEELEKIEEESEEETKDTTSSVPTKHQQKERRRLEKEQARKNKIEERRKRSEEKKRRKEQKYALKKKQKLQLLQQKENSKKQKANKKSHTALSMELDEDLKKVLRMTDSLLEELPDEVVNQFVNSEDFVLYERVLNKYKVYERVINKHRIK